MRHGARSLVAPILAIAFIASLTALADVTFAARPAHAASDVPVATAARLGGDDRRTRFVLDMSDAVGFSVFVLSDPFRVIVDLPEVDFALPEGLGKQGRGLVRAYRYGLFTSGRSRVVIDAASPVLIEKSFSLKAANGQPARLVVDLVRTDMATFERMRAEREAAAAKLAGSLRIRDSRPVAHPVAQKTRPARASSEEKITIVIDPGHGGVDPGAISRSGATEKRIVLGFSTLLARKLKATGRYKVHLTRSNDTFLRLRERVHVARERHADLFLAVHADSSPHRSVRGATVYTLSERASDREAAALAEKENRADIIAGVDLQDESTDVADILIDLAQRETKNHSVHFAKLMVNRLTNATRLTKRPHRYAGFRVLTAPDIPSILLELGYMSSPADEKLLKSLQWRTKLASAVIEAIDSYFSARIASGALR